MWLVGAERWRTTATWSEASAWSELTTLDMFTFLHGLPCLGEGGGMQFINFFGPSFLLKKKKKEQPVVVEMRELPAVKTQIKERYVMYTQMDCGDFIVPFF